MYKHILMPTDGSGRSERAITAGIQLAKQLDARVTVLYIGEATYIEQIDASPKRRAEMALGFAAEMAERAGIACNCVSLVGETPQEVIVEYANSNECDLIVMGVHKRSRVGKFILGSAAASILADCEIPLLLYR